MTPEAQQIAIAEACGWKFKQGTPIRYGGSNIPSGWISPIDGQLYRIYPDYFSNLNAMHEAEKVLTPEQRVKMVNELYNVADRQHRFGVTHPDFDATAAQRAEAFLKTLNLWKP